MTSTAPHVYRAWTAVKAAIAAEGIDKARKNQQQGYSFRGIDDVLNALSSILAENHLIIAPHIRSRELLERTTKDGKGALFNVVVNADYTFISSLDGSTHEVGPFYGEAMDSADKATNKAMSAAYKYMAIQTFCIPTKGDNDADATTHDVAPRQTITNPETGRQINPNSANQLRKSGAWDSFVDRVQGFVEARDGDGLKLWFESKEVSERIGKWAWRDEAQDHYERALERIDDLEKE